MHKTVLLIGECSVILLAKRTYRAHRLRTLRNALPSRSMSRQPPSPPPPRPQEHPLPLDHIKRTAFHEIERRFNLKKMNL
jgi:hypothetical protein